MNISVLLSVNALEDLVNQRYDPILYDGKAQNPDGGITHVSVTKNDRIRIYAEKQSLVTLGSVHIKVHIRRGTPGIFDLIRDFSNLEKTDFDISVRLETAIAILPGWKLETHSKPTFEWDRKPSAGPLNLIQIAEFVKPQLEKELQALAQNIDKYICQEVNFYGMMENAWKEITRPALLPLPLPAMIQAGLSHQEITLKPIIFKGKWIQFPLETSFSVSLQTHFPPHAPTPLPNLKIVNNTTENTSAPFFAHVQWEILNQLIDEQPITLWQGREIWISKPEFFGFEDKIGVKAGFTGKGSGEKGKFELLAECFYDEPQLQISFRKVFFRITHGSLVIRSFAGLFRKKIEKIILTTLQEYRLEQIRLWEKTISETLSDIHPSKGINLHSEIGKLTIEKLAPISTGLSLIGNISGELIVTIASLDDQEMAFDRKP